MAILSFATYIIIRSLGTLAAGEKSVSESMSDINVCMKKYTIHMFWSKLLNLCTVKHVKKFAAWHGHYFA